MIVLYVIIAILVLLLMVLIHEFGHYVVGRALGFKITEFSIGFGKALVSKTNKRGEKISLRLFPLGGYCAFFGEDTDGVDTNPESFVNQKPWKRILVYIAGASFNILSAVIFSFILLLCTGYGNIYTVTGFNRNFEHNVTLESGEVYELAENDVILQVNGKDVDYIWGNTIENALQGKEVGDTIAFRIRKAEDGSIVEGSMLIQKGQQTDKDGNLIFSKDGEPVMLTGLGLNLSMGGEKLSFVGALAKCVPLTAGLAWMVLKAFWQLITFQVAFSQLGGPVTTIAVFATTMSQSFASILVILPLIAVNLGVFNLLPFPALDGAHVVFTTIEWIRKKPINRNVESWIHFAGLMVLLAFIVIVDIVHFFV